MAAKESGLECAWVNNNFTVLVIVHRHHWVCVLLYTQKCVAFKMTGWVEQWLCIKFCLKCEHSSAETIQMIQKAAAMGYWWLAASPWQHAHSCIMSRAEFFRETSNHRGDSASLKPIFSALWLLAFPKIKTIFKRENISDLQRDSG